LIVLLDTGPLGLVTNPNSSLRADAAAEWLDSLLKGGTRVLVPEISDYELRRELLRAGKARGVARLDALVQTVGYLPVSTAAMRRAAAFWARARRAGRPGAALAALDGDVILAAQASLLQESTREPVEVATTDLTHFVAACLWSEITP
jgi:predicted nucleic acid-binding protein